MTTRYWTIINSDNIGEYSYSSTEEGVFPLDYNSDTWIEGDYVGMSYDASTDTWSEKSIQLDELRVQRDALLASSDFTQLADSALSSADVALWAIYRQELRDMTSEYIPVVNPEWPTKP